MQNLKLLTFNQLSILKELRTHSSLRALCVKLSINVSNISREVSAVEEILKTKLITTSPKGFTLTPEGLKASTIAEDIWVQAEKFNAFSETEIDQKTLHTIGGRGYLNLMATQKFSSSPEILRQARLRFLDLPPNEVIQLAVIGVLDSIIHFENYDLPASWMTQTLIKNVQWKIHVQKNHRLTQISNLKMADVLKYPFVLSTSWNGREISSNDDGFPMSWSQRKKGLDAQSALMALQIVANTDQVVFLPELFDDLISTEKITTVSPIDLLEISKNLLISVHTSRVSLQLFNLFIEKFNQGETYEKNISGRISQLN